MGTTLSLGACIYYMSTWSLREGHSALGLGLYVQRFGVLVHSPRPKPSTPDFSASEFSRGKPTSSFGKRFPSSVPWPYAFLTSRNHGASTPDSNAQDLAARQYGLFLLDGTPTAPSSAHGGGFCFPHLATSLTLQRLTLAATCGT